MSNGQPAWRFCDKCFGMFYNGDPDPNRKGRCPAGGQHRAQGFLFVLPHRAFPSASVTVRLLKDDELSIITAGMAFEPDQNVKLDYRIETEGATTNTRTREDIMVRSDAMGKFIYRIPVQEEFDINTHTVDISSAHVQAFDFGSGEMVTASL